MDSKNSKDIPELMLLKARVEEKFGKKLKTTYGFEALSLVMEHEIGELLSASTLKRLWGYVSSNPVPRVSTLDILARYTGEKDFASFCRNLKESGDNQSGFESGTIVLSAVLPRGSIVSIQWNPNRLVRLEHIGGNGFRVVESLNSKLRENDTFEVGCFILGHPLYVSGIKRNGSITPPYIAGSKDGITKIEITDELRK